MGSVRLVTDSTADLGEQAAAEQIAVVPLTVTFGEESFEDGVTIEGRTFFEKLAEGHERPITSQPAPDLFAQTYRRLQQEGATGIVSIHISSKLSGTFSTASRVAETLREEGFTVPIEVLDSQQGSLAMHFGLLRAAQEARAGQDIAAITAAARDVFDRTTVFFVADDLGYLQKGGRIGQAQRIAGSLLNVKPIITLREGAVVSLENPRTRKRAYERLAELVQEMAPVEAVIIGQSAQGLGDQVEEVVRQRYDGSISRMWAGPTIGSHVGPGAVGLAVLRAKTS